jgi:acetolactate synthase-1/2/3 large subunit
MTKYSDLLADWLVSLGYTHCFFVAGGNIMHLLESCSHRLTCVPVVHEVAAGIAAEYFNEVHLSDAKAFALVTAGPGLTNIVTALAGAYLESRELLVLGGQVKVADLSRSLVRQRGIQEIDGVAIAASITEKSILMEQVVDQPTFADMTRSGEHGRKAPVFLEIPLDIQGTQVDPNTLNANVPTFTPIFPAIPAQTLTSVLTRLQSAKRPVLLLGAGIDRTTTNALLADGSLSAIGVPLMVSWNAMDRVPAHHELYFGRPNTWGMRYANILLQQCDLLVALGTRLSLQQTGFNWQAFIPVGDIIHIDCDPDELAKVHPKVATPICGDANKVLRALSAADLGDNTEWLTFCRDVKATLPLVEPVNRTGEGYLNPYVFAEKLSTLSQPDDLIIPCSSGSAFTVMMQTFAQKAGQRIVTNKGLAAMGYGLAGAIGACFAARTSNSTQPRRTILVEGDGGFTQNLQELGTVSVNHLNLKIFLFDDNGYASIRMTQKNYFGGRYIGCDTKTGLGLPIWSKLFEAYSIPIQELRPGFETTPAFLEALNSPGPAAFLVKIDPEQTYFPKISSRVTPVGSMESNPLHRMTPDLDQATEAKVFRYLPR